MKFLFPACFVLLLISCDNEPEVKPMSKADSANMLMVKAGKLVREGMDYRVDSLEGPDTTSKAAMLFADARGYYLDASRLDPQNFKCWSYIGTTFAFTRQHALSVPYFRKSVSLNAGYKEGWLNLGMAYEHLQQTDSAVYAYSQVLRLDSSQMTAYSRLSRQLLVKEKKAEPALELLRTAARHDPASDQPWNTMSVIYFQMKDTVNAIAALQKAAELNPVNKTRLYNLAAYFREKGDSANYNKYLLRLEQQERQRRPGE
jgi:tetratricopeptide (TPR) repeat protein